MSNDYQAPMTDGNDHPLKHVDPAILAKARKAMDEAVEDLRDPEMVEPLADVVVLHLMQGGHLRPVFEVDVREHPLLKLAISVRKMVDDGFPCSGGNEAADEWFEIMCERLRAVEALIDLYDMDGQ